MISIMDQQSLLLSMEEMGDGRKMKKKARKGRKPFWTSLPIPTLPQKMTTKLFLNKIDKISKQSEEPEKPKKTFRSIDDEWEAPW